MRGALTKPDPENGSNVAPPPSSRKAGSGCFRTVRCLMFHFNLIQQPFNAFGILTKAVDYTRWMWSYNNQSPISKAAFGHGGIAVPLLGPMEIERNGVELDRSST